MSREPEGSFERSGLVFFGRLTASVTHELNNVLSTLDQAAGLLGDIAAGATPGAGIDPRRIETICERMGRQVQKGVEIVSRVNRFAHSLDDPGGEFDTDTVTENLVSLVRRFADLKKVGLAFMPSAQGARCSGDAFALQQALFICLQTLMDDSIEGEQLAVGVHCEEEEEVVISLSSSARCAELDDDWQIQEVARLMQVLKGVHRISADEHGGMSIELRFPVVASGHALPHSVSPETDGPRHGD